jgi:SAM-dependent methyltransferase
MEQFTYFSLQADQLDWSGKDVLDFGGNIGNILRDPNSTIDEARYWCMDVTREAIEIGREVYPKGHWLFYDRYNFSFYPRGVPDLGIPKLCQRFDYIVAYSVFTSTPMREMLDLVEQLARLLKPDGRMLFTFIDPQFHSWPDKYDGSNLRWRLERLQAEGGVIDIPRLLENAKRARWCILINNDDLYIDSDEIRTYDEAAHRSIHVFHSPQYISSLFPQAAVLAPVNGEMQHCVVVRRT